MEVKPGDWHCPDCGNHNFAKRQQCNRCKAARPAGPASVEQRPGDWNCECGELNFGSRVACRKCGNAKPNADQEGLCKVCFERPRDCILSCGHVGLCRPCAESVDKCPFCRTPINKSAVKRAFLC